MSRLKKYQDKYESLRERLLQAQPTIDRLEADNVRLEEENKKLEAALRRIREVLKSMGL